MIKYLLLVMTMMGIFGCESVDYHTLKDPELDSYSGTKMRLTMISSGYLGCSLKQIKVNDYYRVQYVAESWTASCGEKTYYCYFAQTSASCSEKK